jgi:predicted signal transduction protein with EAL and GGDEF domain
LTAAAVDELARRLVARLAAPFSVGPLEIQVGASVGAARLPDSRGTEAGFELFAAADRALYDAKSGGRRRYRSATLDACERSRQRRRRA